jgi:hypothetical protein
MKNGGNAKCKTYLKQKGISLNSPIKQKYEDPGAQLYKEVLKARVEGRPEPTQLPPPKNRNAGSTYSGGGAPGKPGEDPNGMERLSGETDQQYIGRQTRLKEQAKARMAAKFGGGGGGMMGGVGSGGSSSSGRMAGIGSDPNYNPNGGFSGGDMGVNSLVAGFGSALSSIGSGASALINDEQTQRSLQNVTSSVASTGGSIWSSFSTGVTSVAATLSQPDGGDGLVDFNRQMASQRSATGSKYGGFGSDSMGGGAGGGMSNGGAGTGRPSPTVAVQECPGLPNEDRNGIAALTGETDEQYVVRQTRIREEAKARMAAKFGGGGLSSASSAAGAGSNRSYAQRPPSAPSSGNMPMRSPAKTGAGVQSAPTSGSWGEAAPKATKLKVESSTDFFANFGT